MGRTQIDFTRDSVTLQVVFVTHCGERIVTRATSIGRRRINSLDGVSRTFEGITARTVRPAALLSEMQEYQAHTGRLRRPKDQLAEKKLRKLVETLDAQ